MNIDPEFDVTRTNNVKMFKLISAIFLLSLTTSCNAQGSWNIGYLKVDSINSAHIGKVVRIDFKTERPLSRPSSQRSIRSFVQFTDTGKVTIDSSIFLLAERRKIYVDHGSYNDQYLECINSTQAPLFIYDATIAAVTERAIQFRLNIEIGKKSNPTKKETQFVWIDRNSLDGAMYEL